MLKKRWLNVVCMLSACCPCLSGDVQRCQRWLGWRLFHIALHGGVLIESGHGLSSGGYARDAVPSDQTVAERDRTPKCSRRSHALQRLMFLLPTSGVPKWLKNTPSLVTSGDLPSHICQYLIYTTLMSSTACGFLLDCTQGVCMRAG